jgi:hypothetical protein
MNEREKAPTTDEFLAALMMELRPHRQAPPPARADRRSRSTGNQRWLFGASVACALVSLVSAGVAHVQHGTMDVTMPQDEAIRALQTLQAQPARLAAIESLRRHAIEAVRRLEITRDIDIFVGPHADAALDSIREELRR